jgi:hypothetical protein
MSYGPILGRCSVAAISLAAALSIGAVASNRGEPVNSTGW